MPIKGIINLPGDKSISHRALLFASLTNNKCVINNISTGQDVETTRKCLTQLGIISAVKEYMPFISVRHPQFECDDVIATYVYMHAKKGDECFVISSYEEKRRCIFI